LVVVMVSDVFDYAFELTFGYRNYNDLILILQWMQYICNSYEK